MRIGVGLSIPELSTRGGRFSPASLFTGGVQGAWYDPSDYSTLFQDSAGATPVTAVEQPVGLMLDKSQGLVLGSELVTNGDFATDTNWTKGSGWGIAGGKASITSAVGTPILEQSVGFSTGTFYKVIFTILDRTAGDIILRLGGGTNAGTFSTNGTFERIFAASGTGNLQFIATSGSTLSVDNVSVKALPGNHASQSTSTSRPVLRARYNLLTYSEEFNQGVWQALNGTTISQNATTAPDGTTTADKIITAASTNNFVVQNAGIAGGAGSYTFSIYAKAAEWGFISVIINGGGFTDRMYSIDLSTGVATSIAGLGGTITFAFQSLANGWTRVSAPITLTGAATFRFGPRLNSSGVNQLGDGVSGVFFWGAQLVTGSSAGTYQRIAAATDYATAGFLPYLAFDGTDDSFGTNSINFTATDKMSVCAGVTKLSDAADGMLVELSATTAANAGSFYVTAPETTLRYAVLSRGSAAAATNQRADTSSTTYNAPSTVVLSGAMNISGDSNNLRLNGTSIATATGDQGTGNYGNYPLYIGRRGGSTVPFNGRIYQLVVCGKTLSASELAALESFTNSKTGAY